MYQVLILQYVNLNITPGLHPMLYHSPLSLRSLRVSVHGTPAWTAWRIRMVKFGGTPATVWICVRWPWRPSTGTLSWKRKRSLVHYTTRVAFVYAPPYSCARKSTWGVSRLAVDAWSGPVAICRTFSVSFCESDARFALTLQSLYVCIRYPRRHANHFASVAWCACTSFTPKERRLSLFCWIVTYRHKCLRYWKLRGCRLRCRLFTAFHLPCNIVVPKECIEELPHSWETESIFCITICGRNDFISVQRPSIVDRPRTTVPVGGTATDAVGCDESEEYILFSLRDANEFSRFHIRF